MAKKFLIAISAAALLFCTGCTAEREDTIQTEGEERQSFIDLPEGTKFVHAGYENHRFFYIYRKRRPEEQPEEFTMVFRSNLFPCCVVFREHF